VPEVLQLDIASLSKDFRFEFGAEECADPFPVDMTGDEMLFLSVSDGCDFKLTSHILVAVGGSEYLPMILKSTQNATN
jgi:hypothetical protein